MLPASTPATQSSKKHYVFVDYENVHHVELSIIGSGNCFLTLLVGARQTKLDTCLVEKLVEHAATVQLVRLTSCGANALDFALAYYMGQAAQRDPHGHFHIISNDVGFEPLMAHIREKGIPVDRHGDYRAITGKPPVPPPIAPPKPALAKPVPPPLDQATLAALAATKMAKDLEKLAERKVKEEAKAAARAEARIAQQLASQVKSAAEKAFWTSVITPTELEVPKLAHLITALRKNHKSRPVRIKTLETYIKELFKNKIPTEGPKRLIRMLELDEYIKRQGLKLIYTEKLQPSQTSYLEEYYEEQDFAEAEAAGVAAAEAAAAAYGKGEPEPTEGAEDPDYYDIPF